MLSPGAILKGLVSRVIPYPAVPDGPEQERALRMGRYGEPYVQGVWPTDHILADEGALMVATTLPGATALQQGIYAAFSATLANIVLGNSDVAGGKRLYPKYLKLACSVAGTSGVDLRYAIVLDSKDRTPSTISNGSGGSGPGTPGANTGYRVPVVSTNMDINNQSIVGVPFFSMGTAGATGPMTVPSAGQFARTIVGNGYIKGSIPVVKDQYVLSFGAADPGGGTFQAAAALSKIHENAPAVAIGPGQFMLIYIWSASNITAGNAFDDVSLVWAER